MVVSVKVVAGPEFERTEAALRAQARNLQRRVVTATKKAVERSYKPTLVGMVPAFMPGGYAPELSASLKVATSVRFAGASPGVTAVVSAPTGGTLGRDVKALEAGALRHPLFGNRGHWYLQRVRRNFASIPLKAVRPQIVREIDAELAAIARDVERS